MTRLNDVYSNSATGIGGIHNDCAAAEISSGLAFPFGNAAENERGQVPMQIDAQEPVPVLSVLFQHGFDKAGFSGAGLADNDNMLGSRSLRQSKVFACDLPIHNPRSKYEAFIRAGSSFRKAVPDFHEHVHGRVEG